MATLALLDGHSIAFRAFYALPSDLATRTGQITNAAFGFTRMLIKLLGDHNPDGLVVTWDVSRQTFRSEKYPAYKEQRDSTPDTFSSQLPLIRSLLSVLGIEQLEKEGFEADDLIATISNQAARAGWEVLVVTGDRDSFQLVSPQIKVLYLRRGVSDIIVADPDWVETKYGIPPTDYVSFAALRGDSSDNLPGVPGVGDKRASLLLSKYRSLEGIYDHLSELPAKQREGLEGHRERVFLNRELMTLVNDVDIPIDIDRYQLQPWDQTQLRQQLIELEFHSLAQDLAQVRPGGEQPAEEIDLPPMTIETYTNPEQLPDLGEQTRGVVQVPGGWVITWTPDHALVGLGAAAAELEHQLFYSETPRVILHDAKPLVRELMTKRQLSVTGLYLDTALAAYVLSPDDRSYSVSELALQYLGAEVPSYDPRMDLTPADQQDPDPLPPENSGENGQGAFALGEVESTAERVEHPVDELLQAAAHHAWAVLRLGRYLEEALAEIDGWQLYRQIELPLMNVLARMEITGIAVDRVYLESLGEQFRHGIEQHRAEVFRLAGEEFLINSTKELRRILFDQMGLPGGKKTPKGQYSTDATVLEKLAEDHQIAAELVHYRKLEKLRSTYVDGYLPLIGSDGRIHTKFNQMVASTGRLSSEEPNLQNIPVRSEEGRTIRRAFIPSPGWVLLVADYSQIELRVLAHLSEDPGLITAFNEANADIHTAAAAKMFEVELGEVTPDMRRKAKGINFGLIYGMEAFGVAQRLNIEREEAREYVNAYFAQFPKVQNFMKAVVAEARSNGYTATLLGRRRYLPRLVSDDFRTRLNEERKALNAPIQGTAADIIKLAMLEVDQRLQETSARLLLQIHDELVIETPPEDLAEIRQLTVEAMEGIIELRVPLTVEVATGSNLAECKS